MLLPDAERRGEIHFYFAKSLPYTARMAVAFSCMVVGLAIETALLDSAFWLGLPFVLAGVAMLLTRGYENKVKPEAGAQEWRPAQRAEVERIPELNRKQMEWDKDFVDVTCNRGFLTMVGVVLLVFLASLGGFLVSNVVAVAIGCNGAVMLLPFWVTGIRSILKNDKLVIKAEQLLAMEDTFERGGRKEGEEFQYQIQTAEARDASGDVPQDVKAILMFEGAPPEFLGLQMQVSINSVQGTDYPYFYCVLVARPEFGGLNLLPPPLVPRGRGLLGFLGGKGAGDVPELVIEAESEREVDIAVIRQETTEKTGYHTDAKAAAAIFRHSLGQARHVLAHRAGT